MEFTERRREGRREDRWDVGERKRRILPAGKALSREYYTLSCSVCFWDLLSGSVNANTMK